MVSRISVLAVDAVDIDLVAGFWCAALGWVERERDSDIVTIGPSDSGLGMYVIRVPEAKTVKNRMHFDVRADGGTREAELERLTALGATRVDVGQPDDVTWTVLADPEGNEFCLLLRTVHELD